MKRVKYKFFIMFFVMIFLVGCNTSQPKEKKYTIVATTFPVYDWIQNIIGENNSEVELKLLLDKGVDLHNYQPTIEDIALLKESDMFVYVGGESDRWVDSIVDGMDTDKTEIVNLLELLGDHAKTEEIIEGMEHEHEHTHEEIDKSSIQARELKDWEGTWNSIHTYFEEEGMITYLESLSQTQEKSIDKVKEELKENSTSDYSTISIKDNKIVWNETTSEYTYLGYRLVEGEHGDSVWYEFTTQDGGAPTYISISDHSIAPTDVSEDTHYHLRYGNDSIESLYSEGVKTYSYYSSQKSGTDIGNMLLEHQHEHEELDEHIWLSLKNAINLVPQLEQKIIDMDPKNEELYKSNSLNYVNELSLVENEYQETLSKLPHKTLLFGDRFPFRYLVDDYNLTYYAAFSGCSAETEASFETVVYLANKTQENAIKYVVVLESSDKKIAETIIENTTDKNQQIVVLDSMQSTSKEDVESGKTYISIMKENLEVLKQVLS